MKAIVLAVLLPACVLAQPDLIIFGGKVVTVDERFSIAEAMTVRGGRIEKVGNDADLLRLKGPETELIDLEGAAVLPGLIDSHTHPGGAAMTEFDHPIPEMETIEDVLSYFRERSRVVPEGEWIDLQQVFITRLREQRYPTRAELDKAAPGHPAIFRTGPDASLNTLALQRCGIEKDFKIPDGVPGKIEKDERGEPTGILRTYSNYAKVDTTRARKPSEADYLLRLTQLFKDYNSVGITTIGDRSADATSLGRYQKLRDTGQLTVRISASHHVTTLGPIAEIQQRIRDIAKHPIFVKPDPMLRLIGIKTFLDGGMLTGSAYMLKPWGTSKIYSIADPTYRGTLFIPRERLLPIVLTTVLEGLQFTAHSVGDGAVHTLLDVYQEVDQTVSIRKTRPCITHCNFMSPEAVDALARLGVVADIQPAWLYLDARTLVAQFGYNRMRYFQPLQSLFKAGAIAGGGSDHMQKIGSFRSINPYNPFLGMHTAITRKARWYNGTLHPEEALTREQAIRFYTANNAFLLFREKEIGSLEPGKLADFIILDRDLLTCSIDDIPKTQVRATYLVGKRIHPIQTQAQHSNWPQFRGIQARGVAEGTLAPGKWERFKWKTPVSGLGLSSPVIWSNKVFITTAVTPKGEQELKIGLYGDIASVDESIPHSWQVFCIDKDTGTVLWKQVAHEGLPRMKRHPKSSQANCTPATDGTNLVCFFGAEGLFCYSLEGRLRWKKDFGPLDSGYFAVPQAQWGFASSPIIHDGMVILQCDVQTNCFLAALDIRDGRQVWRTPRSDVPTWSTPTVDVRPNRSQIIVNGFRHMGGYDLRTGKELWKLSGGGDIPVPTPIISGNLIFLTGAHGKLSPIYAVRADAEGDITLDTNESTNRFIRWSIRRGGNYMQTPIIVGDYLFMCKDNGVVACYTAKTGEKHFEERLAMGRGGFTASPVADADKIHYTSEEGKVYTIRAAPKFEIIATNDLGEPCMATPAISDGELFFRTRHHLVCVGGP